MFVRVYKFIFSRRIWNERQNKTKIFSIISKTGSIKKIYFVVCGKYTEFNLKTLKYHTFNKTHLFILLFTASVAVKMKRSLKKKNQLRD